ncbi:MAG: PspC domain-containing protein [Candidatus Absconditabacteria bacterium]
MGKLQLCGNSYEISSVALDFLNKYFARFEFYTKNNKVNEEMFQDIKSSICEKLSKINREISDKDIIDIINELGEPEDIFELPISNNLKQDASSGSNFDQDKMYYRYPQHGILFGICYGIGKKLQVDPVWIRLIMIILAFFYGLGIIIYFSLFFLMPRAQGNNTSKSIFEKFFSALIGMLKFFFMIFLFFVYFCFGSWFLALGFAGMVTSPFLFIDVSVDNMSLFALVPMYFKIAAIGLSVSSFLFGIWLLVKSIGKKFLGAKFLVFNLFLFVFSLIGFFAGVYDIIFEKYMGEQNFQTQLATIPVLSGETIYKVTQINDKFEMGGQSFERIWNRVNNIKFVNTTGSDIIIGLDSKYYIGTKELGEQIHKNMVPMKVKVEGDSISFDRDGYLSYATKVPGIFASHQIVFYIPNNVKIDFRGTLENYFPHRLDNVRFSNDIFNRLFITCRYGLVSFNTDDSDFQCEKGYKIPSESQKEFEDYIVKEKTITNMMIENPVYKVSYQEKDNDEIVSIVDKDSEDLELLNQTEQLSGDIQNLTGGENIIEDNNITQMGTLESNLTGNEQLSGGVIVRDELTSKILKKNTYLKSIIDKSPDYYEFRWMNDDWGYLFVTYGEQYYFIYLRIGETGKKIGYFSIENMGIIDSDIEAYIANNIN